MKQPVPEFRERAPWWGGDLQTLRNALVKSPKPSEDCNRNRLILPMADGSGDTLSALLEQPKQRPSATRPLIVIVHGLAGAEDSAYMQASAAHWLSRNHSVLRINLRGAGPSRESCRFRYHAGRTRDLDDALTALRENAPETCSGGIVLVGFSLGGNMLLKFLAEFPETPGIRAAASVSAPIDLSAGSRRLHSRRNFFYQRSLLRGLQEESLGGKAEVSESHRQAILAARSIYEFDDAFVAPCNGFADAEDYYARSSALGFLEGIRTPTLLIHAFNDPWIPSSSYSGYDWKKNPKVQPCLVAGGGHVGFHCRGLRGAWHDHAIERFVRDRAEPMSPGRTRD